jgi:hypothetical protein
MFATRNYPLVIGIGVAVLAFSLMAGAAITGVLSLTGKADDGAAPLQSTAAAAAARRSNCATCGVVAALEAVQAETGGLAGYRVTVRMDDGRERSLSLGSRPAYGVGSRVRIVNGNRLERG